MNTAVKTYITLTLLALPTVMFGGFSLLRLTAAARLNDFQRTMFRAGHAHAGVLLIMSLAAVDVMAQQHITTAWCWLIGGLLLTGTLAQSGGMFIHMAVGRPGVWSRGNTLTSAGAAVLTTALVLLVIRILAG